MFTNPRQAIRRNVPARGGLPVLSLALILGLGAGAAAVAVVAAPAPAQAAETTLIVPQHVQVNPALSLIPTSVSTPISRARAALDLAVSHTLANRLVKARAALEVVRLNITKAHVAGLAQIGAPPTDPESDEPPGPPSVLAVLGLEHRVGMDLVPLFNHRTGPKIVDALRYTLRRAHLKRDVMVDTVIALPPEGAGSDYADGMADTLSSYTQEVNQLETGLETYQLSPVGKVALGKALIRVRATKAKVNDAFGVE
jgi:hypothetical protein